MQKIGLMFMLREIFDVAHYHTSKEDFVQIKAKGTLIENFNYLNVAFISYKLTMWDLMLFSGGHTTANALEKKTFLVSRRI